MKTQKAIVSELSSETMAFKLHKCDCLLVLFQIALLLSCNQKSFEELEYLYILSEFNKCKTSASSI